MSIEIKVPVLPESVADAVVAKWHKKVGDLVKQDEAIVDIETDKVVLEVTSPIHGVVQSILFPEQSVVKGQQLIGTIEAKEGVLPQPVEVAKNPELPKIAEVSLSPTDLFSPAVRKMLHQHDLEAENVIKAVGHEKITVEDIEQYLNKQKQLLQEIKSHAFVEQSSVIVGDRSEQRVPMSRMRLKIAERLVQAQHTAAMLTTFNEIDMQPVMDLRARYKEEFEKKHQIKLGFMSFFIKASCHALEHYPVINASIDEQDIVYHNYCDIGVAVASERGLVVPIVRNVQQQSLAQLEHAVADLSKKARQSTLTMDELTGGTFTITNGGVFGSLLSTPILNPPQTAILGMHKIEERPVVVDHQIAIRPMMYVALSYDHRLIDGADAVQFLVMIKTLLQEPERLLLDL
jgi:2-oxoglutarate dehydrogenase E2 component (dihydrolipoamide succinyltransferase)